jgi:hypothetical protein
MTNKKLKNEYIKAICDYYEDYLTMQDFAERLVSIAKQHARHEVEKATREIEGRLLG